jgi:hypothetical protein
MSLAMLSVACSSGHEPAPPPLVERHSSVDPAALDSLDAPTLTSDAIASDAGAAPSWAMTGGGVEQGAANAEVCGLSFEGGPCDTPMDVYWHNPATGMCELKSYGGCEGNGNRFVSPGECVEVCGGSAPAPCEFAEQMYQPGQAIDTVCGACQCDPAGSGQLHCPMRGDAAPCEAQGVPIPTIP